MIRQSALIASQNVMNAASSGTQPVQAPQQTLQAVGNQSVSSTVNTIPTPASLSNPLIANAAVGSSMGDTQNNPNAASNKAYYART